MNWLLHPKTKPCHGCAESDPHDAHLTVGYRVRLRIYGLLWPA